MKLSAAVALWRLRVMHTDKGLGFRLGPCPKSNVYFLMF